MSREGDDGMGDVIRKAAPPPGEGSYKKVRDKKGQKGAFVCHQAGPAGMLRECCPDPAQAGAIRGLQQGNSVVFKVLARGSKPSSLIASLSPGDKQNIGRSFQRHSPTWKPPGF